MDISKEGVVKVLMDRDSMHEEDARDLVDECQDEINDMLEAGAEGLVGVVGAETIIYDYFGLEPDYLMAFLEY